jgi:hypothetical protein
MSKRSQMNRALAKALAYAECGKFEEAERWGKVLIALLEWGAVFKAGSVVVREEPMKCLPSIEPLGKPVEIGGAA